MAEELETKNIYYKVEKYLPAVVESMNEISELNGSCKGILRQYLTNPNSLDQLSLKKIEATIDYIYEQVNIGNWKEVQLYLRKTITIASFLKLLAHLKLSDINKPDIVKESYKIIDFGILFGCPIDHEPKLLQKCASIFNCNAEISSINDSTVCENTETTDIEKISGINDSMVCENTETTDIASKTGISSIEVIDCPSMEYFYKNYILKENPVILTNCINHWPALTKWKNPEYFKNLAGSRTVPIELGRIYTDSDWTQKLTTLEEFIDNYIYQSKGPTGYLAQYQLFDQIPELKKDISEPEYCSFSESDEPVDVMAWFGPKGTLSALHHDPKKNLLTQVIGEKQLYLFAPKDSEYLYPNSHDLLNNTAQVDPREPDLEKYPDFKHASPLYCVLRPSQMLYIPPKWWHFVESLSISFSVSFWWD